MRITPEQVVAQWFTFPDDGEEGIQELRAVFLEIDKHEHPDTSKEPTLPPPGGTGTPPPAGGTGTSPPA